jgi:copper chaperone CopZ
MVRLFGKKRQQIELVVRGMTCGHCEMRVKKALVGVPGVLDAEASHEREQAVVTVDAEQEVSMEALVAAVQAAGYEAEGPAEG